MEQDMTTSTNAEAVFKQQQEWIRTSGGAVPWIFASSNVSFVPMPSVGTVALEPVFSVVPSFEWLPPRAEEQLPLPLFRVQGDPLQHAMLNLVTYTPEPDQPSDLDVGPELGYGLPR
jgi:hypothetical protein